MNILVTGAWNCTQEQLECIAGLGHRILFQKHEQEPLSVAYDIVEGVICNGLFLYHPIEKFTNLRYIQLTSAGFDRVPVDYIRAKGIVLHNARDVYSIPMAEFALCGVLQLYKHSRFFLENQKKNRWQKHRGLVELYGKTVCIIGCGSVGTECAKRFQAFSCNVIGADLTEKKDVYFSRVIPIECLEELLPEADIVVLALPLTEQTRHIINAQRLKTLKKDAVLVNISRGAVVDSVALMQWLEAGLGAAVLDVFEEEPLSEDSPLWHMDNVILTPHNSFVGEGNEQRLYRVIRDHLIRA